MFTGQAKEEGESCAGLRPQEIGSATINYVCPGTLVRGSQRLPWCLYLGGLLQIDEVVFSDGYRVFPSKTGFCEPRAFLRRGGARANASGVGQTPPRMIPVPKQLAVYIANIG